MSPGDSLPVDMAALAVEINAGISDRIPAADREQWLMRGGLKLAEEAGEVVGALNRYLGYARRSGTLTELADELADLAIVTHTLAHRLGIDLNRAVTRKAGIILTRGWRETPVPPLDSEAS